MQFILVDYLVDSFMYVHEKLLGSHFVLVQIFYINISLVLAKFSRKIFRSLAKCAKEMDDKKIFQLPTHYFSLYFVLYLFIGFSMNFLFKFSLMNFPSLLNLNFEKIQWIIVNYIKKVAPDSCKLIEKKISVWWKEKFVMRWIFLLVEFIKWFYNVWFIHTFLKGKKILKSYSIQFEF